MFSLSSVYNLVYVLTPPPPSVTKMRRDASLHSEILFNKPKGSTVLWPLSLIISATIPKLARKLVYVAVQKGV